MTFIQISHVRHGLKKKKFRSNYELFRTNAMKCNFLKFRSKNEYFSGTAHIHKT